MRGIWKTLHHSFKQELESIREICFGTVIICIETLMKSKVKGKIHCSSNNTLQTLSKKRVKPEPSVRLTQTRSSVHSATVYIVACKGRVCSYLRYNTLLLVVAYALFQLQTPKSTSVVYTQIVYTHLSNQKCSLSLYTKSIQRKSVHLGQVHYELHHISVQWSSVQ